MALQLSDPFANRKAAQDAFAYHYYTAETQRKWFDRLVPGGQVTLSPGNQLQAAGGDLTGTFPQFETRAVVQAPQHRICSYCGCDLKVSPCAQCGAPS